jgi:serine/threonine protein kinase
MSLSKKASARRRIVFQKERNIFGNVFCERDSLEKDDNLFQGYLLLNENLKKPLTLLREKTDNCVYCNGRVIDLEHCCLERRQICGQLREYHYVAYTKFTYNLTTFVTSEDHTVENTEVVTRNILCAIQSLHQQKFFNFNINPDVIIIDRKFKVKFLDFFMSRDNRTNPVVPMSYYFDPNDFASPELIFFRDYGKKFVNNESADIFSISCCIFFIYTLNNPFARRNSLTCTNIIRKDFVVKFQTIDYVMLLDEYKKPLLKDLIAKTLNYKFSERLDLSNALRHPFFWNDDEIDTFFTQNIEKIKNPHKYLKCDIFDGDKCDALLSTMNHGDTTSSNLLQKNYRLLYVLHKINKVD